MLPTDNTDGDLACLLLRGQPVVERTELRWLKLRRYGRVLQDRIAHFGRFVDGVILCRKELHRAAGC